MFLKIQIMQKEYAVKNEPPSNPQPPRDDGCQWFLIYSFRKNVHLCVCVYILSFNTNGTMPYKQLWYLPFKTSSVAQILVNYSLPIKNSNSGNSYLCPAL